MCWQELAGKLGLTAEWRSGPIGSKDPNTTVVGVSRITEEISAWCFANGRNPSEEEIFIFNSFLTKRGWNDDSTAELEEMKRKRGLAGRTDIQTFFDFHRADEEAD
jgi:hypothetical protein